MKIFFIIISFIFIFGCSSDEASPPRSKITKQTIEEPVIPTKDHTAFAEFPFFITPSMYTEIKIASTEPNWSSDNLPEWLNLDSKTGILSGLPPESGAYEGINLFVQQNGKPVNVGPISIRIKNDPLINFQWGIKNLAQSSFSQSSGVTGEDINIWGAYQLGYSGKNILIGISDVSVQTNHEDLIANNFSKGNRNYLLPPTQGVYSGTPAPDTDSSYGHHGTAVAGIIAGVGWNGLGIKGVAPKAFFSTMNFIESDQSLSKLIDQIVGPYDIVNQSWGVSNTYPTLLNGQYLSALKTAATQQRNGKGTVIVKAAGNGYKSCGNTEFCSENSNQDAYNTSPYVIVVGAFNAEGKKSSYSSVGSNIWISAPGGEFGEEKPAILTTDLMNCSDGLSNARSSDNNFESGSESLNFTCNYTSTFNGTSSAAPFVSGAVALILEANPNLKLRDIKHILAQTARKIEPNSAPLTVTKNGQNLVFSHGWITNAAGFHFHNNFGFGALDVEKAVNLAKSWTNLSAASEIQLGFFPSINQTLGESESTTREFSFPYPNNKIIETLEVDLKIEHSYFGDISIELISPSGTRSILLTPFNTYKGRVNSSGENINSLGLFHLLSNAFYGESTNGTWKVIVSDSFPNDSGKINEIKLTAQTR